MKRRVSTPKPKKKARKTPPAAKPTQLARAIAIVRDVSSHARYLRFCELDLDVVLGEAQNGPPDGAADGSIGDEQWRALKMIQRGLHGFCDGYDAGITRGKGFAS